MGNSESSSLALFKKGNVMIKASIIGVCILTLVIAFSLRQSDFRPIDFARFRIVEANVVNSNGSRAAIFSKPEHLLTLKQYFLKLKKMNTSYSRLNSGGYFMKVYFEDHDHVDVFFYDNEESGKIITFFPFKFSHLFFSAVFDPPHQVITVLSFVPITLRTASTVFSPSTIKTELASFRYSEP
jgi:hypothetical protein